ncbi:MAG: hypothetical protein M3Z04_14595, partial [Chloroflexota bacterium]|nr:hypothetical protein [Chloroflexota bacterium]
MIRPTPAAGRLTLSVVVGGVDAPRELLALAVTLLDLLWLHPLLVLLAGSAADGTARLALWPLVALALGARAWVVWQDRYVSRPLVAFVLTAPLVLVSIAGLLWLEFVAPVAGLDGPRLALFFSSISSPLYGPVAVTTVVGSFLWWRTLSGQGLAYDVDQFYRRFGGIVLTYGGYWALSWIFNAPYATPVLIRDLFLLFIVGLSGLTLARAQSDRERSRGQLGTNWLLGLLGGTGVVLALGLLLAGLLGGDIAAALFNPLAAAVQLVGLVLLTAFELIGNLVLGLFYLLFGWMTGLQVPATPTPTPAPVIPGEDPTALLQRKAGEAVAAGDPLLLRLLGLTVVLLGLLWLGRKIFASLDRRRRLLGGGERESLFNWRAALESLADLLPNRPPSEPDSLLALAADPAYRHTVRVRRAYRRALAQAAAAGTARLPAQT